MKGSGDVAVQMLELCGSVEDVIYRNNENGYTVMAVLCDGLVTTAVGCVADINIGDDVRLVGVWKNHTEYGQQFAFEFCEQRMPSTASSILKYLSSRALKGIGGRMGKRLVDAFGDDTLNVIMNDPQRLTQIKGISSAKANELSEELRKIFGMREVMSYLEKYRVSALEAVRIWKKYGDGAITLIEQNPFILCDDEVCVSFERADAIASALGMDADDPSRIRAGLMYCLSGNLRNGHTCLPKNVLIRTAAGYMRLEEEKITAALEEMIMEGGVVSEQIDGKDHIFLPAMYRSEATAAERLSLMLQFPPERITGGELALQNFEEERGISYAALQRRAIVEALTGGLLVLTGGPGTGKTTTLNAIIGLYERCGLKVMLAAPTGRAAQRMSEVTGREAKTIHRMLEVEWGKNDKPRFAKNERNVLDCDALILDEMSMVDSYLFEGVMRALRLGCRLIMVGDSDQLPSVGAGNVLADIIASDTIPVIRLTEIFRQSMQSLIVTNAHKIVHGEMPETDRRDRDFFFLREMNKERIASTIVGLCSQRLPKAYGYSPMTDIQVLCPGRKTDLGVTELNKKLQAVLNPPGDGKAELGMPVYVFRTGDKVMQTKNNYDLPWTKDDGTSGSGVFNGDIGLIEAIDKSSGTAVLRFDDRTVTYNSDELQNVELAYATTVHKSQGNEFDAVVMPIFNGPPQLYYRNLLYTAVTRAKKILILVGDVKILKNMVDNDRKTRRYTALCAFLKKACAMQGGTDNGT